MDNAVEIGRVKRDAQVDIVVRRGDFMGNTFLDIREYLKAESFEGFTKRGLRIPVSCLEEFLMGVAEVGRNPDRIKVDNDKYGSLIPDDALSGNRIIACVDRDGQVSLVIRLLKNPYGRSEYVDLREYLKADSFEGYTKRGIKVSGKLWPGLYDVLEGIFGLRATIIKKNAKNK